AVVVDELPTEPAREEEHESATEARQEHEGRALGLDSNPERSAVEPKRGRNGEKVEGGRPFDDRILGEREKVEKAGRHARGGRAKAQDEEEVCGLRADVEAEGRENVDHRRASEEPDGEVHRRRVEGMPE